MMKTRSYVLIVQDRISTGFVKRGHHNYSWWRHSVFAEHKDWYFDESNVIASFEFTDAWTTKKIEFSNLVANKMNTRDFMIPKACL